MPWLAAFIAGFASTLVFHQGVVALFNLFGVAALEPYAMQAVPPFGVPKVLSLAFWGGVWGLPLWWLMRRWQGVRYWLSGVVGGAVGPTAVAMLVVFPLKGLEVSARTVAGGLVVNGAWGLGVALVMLPVLLRAAKSGDRREGAGDHGSSPD